jgi:mycothiol synthase
MVAVEPHSSLDGELLAEVRGLVAAVEARDGAPPLSDHALLELGHSGAGLVHLVARGGNAVAGYAQFDGTVAEVADGEGASSALLAALEASASRQLLVWSHGRRSPVAAAADARGYVRHRALWQLRRPIAGVPDAPLPEAPLPDGVTIRAFEPGKDENAWLAVNAAAFAEHAEQGRWTRIDVEAREAEPWFDPAGFLLAEKAGTLLGFHWTKAHDDRLGEVYVLGVDPKAKGMRLGPALLSAGLDYLRGRGLDTVMLYVDESNDTAMRLYERFGFERYDVDAQYLSPIQGIWVPR